MARREYSGNANYTATLNADITTGSTTITLNTGGGTGFPTGASGNPFFIVIDPGTTNEEKVLITSRSSDSLTVSARAQDGTTAVAHSSGVKVQHVLTATDINDVNAHAFDTTRDDHSQYMSTTVARTVSAAHTYSAKQTITGGGLDVNGSPSAYTGGELRFFNANAALGSAVSTLSTGAPSLSFDHRGASNTGSWSWGNGTTAGTQRMSLDATGNLSLPTGGATIVGSQSGYSGGETRLGPTTASVVSAITTQATGTPTLTFGHRGASNVGQFFWANGTSAGTLLMDLAASANNLRCIGNDNKFGVGALGAAGAYVRIGDVGDASGAYFIADGSGTNIQAIMRAKGTGGVSLQDAPGNGALGLQTPISALTSGQTAINILAYHNGTSVVQQRVTVGAADSGGVGFKALRVPN